MHTDSVEISVSVPASVADAGAPERARVLLVLDAVRAERLTWRAAADALGIAPDALLDLARVHGIPIQRYGAEEVREDLATLDKLARLRDSGG